MRTGSSIIGESFFQTPANTEMQRKELRIARCFCQQSLGHFCLIVLVFVIVLSSKSAGERFVIHRSIVTNDFEIESGLQSHAVVLTT